MPTTTATTARITTTTTAATATISNDPVRKIPEPLCLAKSRCVCKGWSRPLGLRTRAKKIPASAAEVTLPKHASTEARRRKLKMSSSKNHAFRGLRVPGMWGGSAGVDGARRSCALWGVVLLGALSVAVGWAQDFGKVQLPSASAPSTFQSGGVAPIGPGDLLEVTVFDTPELSGKVRVSSAGDVSLPLIGALHVAGLKTDEMQSLVARKLIDGQMVNNPQVSVFMVEYATQGVSVLGEVKKPGIYPTLGQHRLMDYISLAEGLTPLAGAWATITPRAQTPVTTVALSSKSASAAARNPEISPGDTIFVSKAGIVYVVGDVGKPGGFVMDHDERLTVLQAIALAQGVNSTAAKKH